jgi:PST family polysaccharide transporter
LPEARAVTNPVRRAGSAERAQLAERAVRGAAWVILAGLGARVLGMIVTLLLTYFLDPGALGEVSGASILVLSASQLGTLGVGQYIIAHKGRAGRDVTWHATMIHQLLGVVTIGTLLGVERQAAVFLHSPNLQRLVPGFVVSVLIDRITFIPERVLARDMRFRVLSLSRTAGEIAYSACALALAAQGLGAMSIVIANVARSLLRACVAVRLVEPREWLTPCPLSPRIVRDMFAFGWPLCVGSVAELATRRWDNLAVERLFGPSVMGEYNQAYNLAEIPGTQIGEQMGDVLLPTLASLNLDDKKRALVRSLALMSLIVFPLSIGLGAIAPTLVSTLLRPQWQGVAPMLAILSGMSIVRPFGWTISAYLQVRQQTRTILWLDVSKVVTLIGLIAALGIMGPLWACSGVGLAYGLNAIASMWVVRRLDGVPISAFLVQCGRPLAACVPLCAAVIATRSGIAAAALVPKWLGLLAEIAAGAAAYVVCARLIARDVSDDFLQLVRQALPRKRRVAPGPYQVGPME